MKIADPQLLFVNHGAELGGGELALLDLMRCLPNSEALLFAPGPLVERLNVAGVSVDVLRVSGLLDLRRDGGWWAALRHAPALAGTAVQLASRFRGFDLIYANSQKALIAAAPAALLAGRPLIWHLHDIMTASHFGGTARRAAIGFSNRAAAHVIVNSAATAQAYRSAGGARPVTVIHNGIDPAPFVGAIPRQRAGRRIGLFGRLAPWKGQLVAIEALARLPDHELWLVGAPLFGESDFERALHARAAAPDVAGRVRFLGFIDDIAATLREVDVAIHCSTSPEPFGRVIVEAMLAARPVIAAAAGGALEIVTDGITGLLTPPGDPAALANAIAALDATPERAQSIAAAGRHHALATFTLTNAAARTRTVISQVMQNRS